MKMILVFLLPSVFIFGSLFNSKIPFAFQQSEASPKLADMQSVKYASNLLDWKNKKVDSLVMDLFYPTNASSSQKYPVLVFCHAGGFASGTRFNVSAICDEFADNGFIAIAIDYRTGYNKGSGKCT